MIVFEADHMAAGRRILTCFPLCPWRPLWLTALLLFQPIWSYAQTPPGTPSVENIQSMRQEVTNGQKTQHHIGHVELKTGELTIFADDAWFYSDEHRFVANGNVVFAEGNSRISAERADFNTETRMGTFFTAWGVAPVQPPRQASRPGAFVPPVSTQDTYVYFFGDTIEKVGPKKYKITKGGFTTSKVSPRPRMSTVT